MSRLTFTFLLTVAVCFSFFSFPVLAATELVPSQYSTIQSAMNAAVSGDTVLVDDGTYTGPGNVDLDFNGKSLTVIGENGSGSTIIDCGGFPSNDGSGNHRGFYIHSGETRCTIIGFTIQNGYESQGGAISSAISGTTVIDNCLFKNNSAVTGGGLSNDNHTGSSLQMLGCTFTGNTSRGGLGGGLYNENDSAGTASISRCNFTGNQAPGGSGGGVCNENVNGGKFSLYGCALQGNSVGANGGGLEDVSTGGSSVVTDCVFTGNTVNLNGSTGGQGDGLFTYAAQSSTIAVTSCTLTGNSDSTSTCLSNTVSGSGTTTLTNDIFYGDAGGEITGSAATATYCDIQNGYPGTGNISVDPLFVSAPSDLQLKSGSPCLGAGTATGGSTRTIDLQTRPNPPSIGAYEMQPASLTPTTTTLFSYNNPTVAGQLVNVLATVGPSSANFTGTVTFTVDGTARPAIQIGTGRSVNLLTSSLSIGSHTITASYSGDFNFSPSTSAVLTQVVNPHISPVYVSPSGNDSSPGSQAAPKLTLQGGINATLSGDTVIVEDGTYSGPGNVDLESSYNNVIITSQNGPAITIIDCGGTSGGHRGFIQQFGETGAVINGLTIQNGDGYSQNGNSVTGGGAIDNISGTLTVDNCVLKNNTGDGGAIFNTGTLSVTKSTLSGNSAGSAPGGGIDNSSGTLSLLNCIISGNSAAYGGGINNATNTAGSLKMVNCLVLGNTSTGDSGGGLYNSGYYGANTVTNCTFSGNTASYAYGGGILSYLGSGNGMTLTLTNDIVYGDSSEISGNFTQVSYSDIQGGYNSSPSNINAAPLFFSASDFHLQAGSPCLGAGTAAGAPLFTLDGKSRPNPPSIGAYETIPLATTLAVSNASGTAGQSVTLSATLTATSGGALSGKTLAFSVDGTAVGTAVTTSTGAASLTYTIPAQTTPGSHTISVTFAGDSSDNPSSGTGTLTVSAASVGQVRFYPRSSYPSRMVGGQFQGSSDNANWITLATVTTTPPANQYSTLPTSADPATFRYLRYLAPNGSYGNVAEIEFDSHGTKLTGTGYGTAGSYNNDGLTFSNALDGNTSTYFDAPAPGNGDFVGIDRGGAGGPNQVRFYPRSTYPSRMVGGLFQGSANNSTWTTLATVTTMPPANAYSTLPTSADPATFRYLRYLAPNGSYGNVAEIEFDSNGKKLTGTGFGTAGSYNNDGLTFGNALDGNTSTYFDAPAPGNGDFVGIDQGTAPPTYTKLTGTGFGTAGSYNNDGLTFSNALDGNLNTYFDAPAPGSGDFVGIDLGSGHTAVVTRIGYCPRSGYGSRMVSGVFQGSNDNATWTALTTVTTAPAAGVLTQTTAISSGTAYRYLRYLAPNGSYGNVAEVEFDTSP